VELLRGMWWPGARRSGLTTVGPRCPERSKKGAAVLRVSKGAAAARFRVLGRGGSLLVGQRPTLACGPEARELAGSFGGRCAGEERGREKGCCRAGPAWQREKGRGESACASGEAGADKQARGGRAEGESGPGHGPCGKKRGEGEGKLGRAKEEVWAAFFYSFSFPFLFLYSNHSNKSS
jgi:hypothetical protein